MVNLITYHTTCKTDVFSRKKNEIGDFLIDLLERYCPDFFLVENFADSWNTLVDYISIRYCEE